MRPARSARFFLTAIGLWSGFEVAELWRSNAFKSSYALPVLHQGTLYGFSGRFLTAVDAASGELVFRERLRPSPGRIYASPLAADGKIYLVNTEGKAAVLKAGAEWEVLTVNDLREEVSATTAISDGRIFVRTKTTLYCFGKGPPATSMN